MAKIVNAQLVSRDMSYRQLSRTEQTKLKAGYGRLWEVMAAGNVVPLGTQGARTVNFEYLPKDKKELSLFAGWLNESLGVPTSFNKATLKLVVKKSGSMITVNFKERKDPEESRKQTPTKIQEKGTTDVFNSVLDRDKRYNSIIDMRKDAHLMKTLRDTFTREHADKIDDWMNTYFNQQDLFFMKKYSPSGWSPFEYHKKDFVHFWSEFIKKVKTHDGTKVGDYTTWNPSDIWAVKNKKDVNDAIDLAFKKDKNDPKLSMVNNLLITLMKNKELVGISLKKIESSGAHMEEMNITPKTMKLAEVIELKMSDIELQLDNIVQQEKVTTYIKFAGTHTMNINLGDKKKFGNLSFNTQVKGTAAQGGQAPVKLVEKLLTAEGTSKSFSNDHTKYPHDIDTYETHLGRWEREYNFVKTKTNNPSWPNWDEFNNYLNDFYLAKKPMPQLAVSKLMQVSFYYDALKNYKTNQSLADFWIALLHLGMKVGDRFAPHAKIS
tara:strand:- start:19 stop:1497 length:1479 start_codon:yes stop_codon:yes gene_type:complete